MCLNLRELDDLTISPRQRKAWNDIDNIALKSNQVYIGHPNLCTLSKINARVDKVRGHMKGFFVVDFFFAQKSSFDKEMIR